MSKIIITVAGAFVLLTLSAMAASHNSVQGLVEDHDIHEHAGYAFSDETSHDNGVL